MNFFGIGGAELIMIVLIMLIVAGPKRMIQWSYVVGQWVGKARTMWAQAVDVLQHEIDEAGGGITLPKEPPNRQNLTRMVSEAVKPYTQELETTWKETESVTKAAVRPPIKPQTMNLYPQRAAVPPKAPPAAEVGSTATPTVAPATLGSWNGRPQPERGTGLGSWSAPKEDA